MKKFFKFTFAAAILFLFLSCGDYNNSSSNETTNQKDGNIEIEDSSTDSSEVPDDDTDVENENQQIPDNEIRKGVYKLDGIEADLKTDDLLILKKLIGPAEVVALGESIHTSGGYYRMKHRIFRFLVEEMGFRAFAFESPWIKADIVGEYVEKGESDVESAVTGGLFSVWASRETVDLVEYMRKWNRDNPKDPLYFFGFDLQQPEDDSKKLFAYLKSLQLPESHDFIERIKLCDRVSGPTKFEEGIPDEEFKSCMEALNELESWSDTHREKIIKKIGKDSFEWFKIHIMGLVSWEEEVYYATKDNDKSYDARDSKMAVMFEKMRKLRYPGIKCVIWAHNWHIAEKTDILKDQFTKNVKSMGTHLSENLQDNYFSIALIGYEVYINWKRVFQGQDSLPGPDSIETKLHELGEEYLFVDLESPSNDSFIPQDDISFFNSWAGDIYEQFDGALFLDKTEGMEALLW